MKYLWLGHFRFDSECNLAPHLDLNHRLYLLLFIFWIFGLLGVSKLWRNSHHLFFLLIFWSFSHLLILESSFVSPLNILPHRSQKATNDPLKLHLACEHKWALKPSTKDGWRFIAFWYAYMGQLEAFDWSDQLPLGWYVQEYCKCPLSQLKCTFDLLIEQTDCFFVKRKRAHQQSIQNDTATPYIDRCSFIFLLPYDLRSSIVRTTTGSFEQLPIFHEIGESKINNFDDFVASNEYIFWFKIPMSNQIMMRIRNPTNNLLKKEPCIFLTYIIILNIVIQLSSFC